MTHPRPHDTHVPTLVNPLRKTFILSTVAAATVASTDPRTIDVPPTIIATITNAYHCSYHHHYHCYHPYNDPIPSLFVLPLHWYHLQYQHTSITSHNITASLSN